MGQKGTWRMGWVCCVVGLAAFTPYAYAESNLTVQVWGTVVESETCSPPYNGPHVIVLSNCNGTAKDHGTLKIAARDTNQGPARVEASDATGADSIKLLNAKIWSTVAPPSNCDAWNLGGSNPNFGNCPYIVFSADFDPGPEGSSSSPVTFYRKAKGDLKKSTGGGAPGSSFRVEGTVDAGTINGPAGKEAILNSFGIDLPTTAYWPNSGARELLGQIWFQLKFANTHILNLEYVSVENPPGGGTAPILGDLGIVGQTPDSPGNVVCCKMCPEDKKTGGKHKKEKGH